MTKYAYFDPADGKVISWIDTNEMAFVLPKQELLHECSEDDWEQRGDGKAVVNGRIVQYVVKADSTPAVVQAAKSNIDASAAAIYARFARFEGEYALRESQAQAYKDAGYTGDVPEQVNAYAVPAKKTARQATDIILAQASAMRGALNSLGVLRMRKYEFDGMTDVAQVEQKRDEILAQIAAIAAAL